MTDQLEPPKMPTPYVYKEDGKYYMRTYADHPAMEIGEDYYNNWIDSGGKEYTE